MSLNETTVLEVNPEVSTRKYLKSTIIEPGITLNEVATSLFEKINGEKTLSEICKDMMGEYEVDYDLLLEDCTELVQGLVKQNVIILK
ncbi:PqqD family protein [Paenibacillus wenxiniae]|uniref:PqqD family protein n=1 Tax=Paenibacillus wenxiniae TaxID=1636843 RepID=A0ABW4RQ09_9BACL